MDKEQEQNYRADVDKWKNAVTQYGTGWDEDGPEIPVDYPIDVDMVNYQIAGLFRIFDGKEAHLFSMPTCDVLARVRKVKAHMNRMISAMEFAREDMSKDHTGQAIPVYPWAQRAVEYLKGAHHGDHYRVIARGQIATHLEAHATKLPSTLPWDIGCGYEMWKGLGDGVWERRYILELRVCVFTTCPFVLFETDGKQSHTQRSYVTVKLKATDVFEPGPIMRELSTRLVPVMSNMKIPDEVIQVLKSYAGPTYTEDAAVRVQKILRGITAEFVPNGEVTDCTVEVLSEDSHLAHDIKTTLDADLEGDL